MPREHKFDYLKLQHFIDSGYSYRDLNKEFGIGMNAINYARKKGWLTTRSHSEGCVLRGKTKPLPPMSDDARASLSKRMSENNPGGKSKWYEVNGIKVQGTWERNFALWCNEQNIKWIRPASLIYEIEGKRKRYCPDFYLPDKELYIEIKGYWWGNDRQKMKAVLDQYPDIKIKIIDTLDFGFHV